MRDWNVLVAAAPGPGRKSRLLRRVRALGWFEPTEFKNVCLGNVEDRTQFLEMLRIGREKTSRGWLIWRAPSPSSKPFHSLPKA